jgi:hypothetical protein
MVYNPFINLEGPRASLRSVISGDKNDKHGVKTSIGKAFHHSTVEEQFFSIEYLKNPIKSTEDS